MPVYDIQVEAEAIALAAARANFDRATSALQRAAAEAMAAVERMEREDSALALVVAAMERTRDARQDLRAAYALAYSVRRP